MQETSKTDCVVFGFNRLRIELTIYRR